MYAWLIVQDHLHDEDPDEVSDDAGRIGPSDADEELVHRLHNGEGETWSVWDDDGIKYFTGRIVTDDPDEMGTEDFCVAPLRDYAGPGAGAVHIEYPRHPDWTCEW